ncbi:MAG: hypothetical protein ACRDTC_17715 [Pseudonocardiaceae bacterium]
MAISAMVATAGSASASATLTVAEYGLMSSYPYGTLTVFGTATCNVSSGTATISVSAFQIVMHSANGFGTTTVSCASSPTTWEVTVDPYLCDPYSPIPLYQEHCFLANSLVSTDVTLTRNGVQEAAVFQTIGT